MIWFVHVITRTRCSKTYLTKIGVIWRRVALITSPMTWLFGRSHMRISGRKMKKKRCEWKRCEISWQLEIYKGGGWFYKVSMKNCTIKPRTAPNKIKTKFKKFLFLIYNIMKKWFYHVWAEYLILPNRLWKLVEIYWKPVRKMLEYDPSKVDDEYWNVEYLHYATWHVERKNFEWTIYCDYETAEKVREENTLKQIWRVMQDKWYKIKDIEKKCYRELSGGQQQRVLLARALCATEKMLLLDEPVSGLDPMVTLEMYDLIDKLNDEGITIIMISHDIACSVKYAKHVLHIGNNFFFGSVEDYKTSAAGAKYLEGGHHHH